MVFDEKIYVDYRDKRINVIINYYGKNWFKNKTVLELGCGYAGVSGELSKLGAINTVSDAREEHLNVVKQRYPSFNIIKCDLDKEWNFDDCYDLIIHMGTLYHLKNYEQNLKNCANNCKNMFLETIVSDSDDDNYVSFINEKGEDQSFNEMGCRPSEKNIEKILTENGFIFERYFKSKLNSGMVALVDWEIKNTKKPYTSTSDMPFVWLRRDWFCKK